MKKTYQKCLRLIFFVNIVVFLFAGFSTSSHFHQDIEDHNKPHKDCQICIFALDNHVGHSQPPVLSTEYRITGNVLHVHTIETIQPVVYGNNQPHAPPLT